MQQLAQKRQLERVLEDCKRVCNPDVTTPFSSLADAVDRLLPYHILAGETAEEADAEEAATGTSCIGCARRLGRQSKPKRHMKSGSAMRWKHSTRQPPRSRPASTISSESRKMC
ncbi:hypothetical protein WJX72_012247 [[Myrmecia] bisecta]|uniref:GLTSCR protein conserved domain-containing protein n=1 Tax=[Myrmecia] bisecta TaxID=41462 RepID=A0AAW1QH15_9CHLO